MGNDAYEMRTSSSSGSSGGRRQTTQSLRTRSPAGMHAGKLLECARIRPDLDTVLNVFKQYGMLLIKT
eukprot:6186345-Pleurochrysis_carterae.AAC.2